MRFSSSLQKTVFFFACVFLSQSFIFANFDTVNTKSCGGCGNQYYWTGWSPYDAYEERQYQMVQVGSGTMSWKCSKASSNGCNNPNCSSGSKCSIHNTSCSCSYGGGSATGVYNRQPRWSCLGTPSVSLANSHPASPNESTPYTLPQNYYYSIVPSDTANKCEYVCNTGYIHVVEGGVSQCRLPLCLASSTVSIANSSPVSALELPSSLTLTHDYPLSVVERGVDTAEKCEYTCNVGFVRDVIGGVTQCRLARCDANPSTLFTNALPVTNAELPATLPYTFTKDYTQTLVINGTDTAEKCEYTCDNGYRADLTKNPKQCIPIVCTGNVATNGTKCVDDETNLSGHLDIARVRRASQTGCTAPQKCEWYCPADKPVYCATKNACVTNLDDCGCDKGEKMCGNGQCIAGNATCPSTNPAQCNNDGVCSDSDSCDCGDCTNGDTDDTNNCKAKDGLRCTRDDTNLACTAAACCPAGTGWNCSTNSCQNQCGVHVPTELKAGIDTPYITCDAQPGTTHFRYQIVNGGTTYTSPLFVNGTSAKHVGPLMSPGTYSVKCLYGTSVTPTSSMTPSTCTKTITVKDQSDTTVQGCSRIYAYKGDTLSDDMTNMFSFDASFRCGSRKDTGILPLPYKLINGSQTAYLMADPLNLLGIGFLSTQTQNYTFNTSSDVTCAVKVGDGYSTSDMCKIHTCIGTDCSTPETFIITPSSNTVCSANTTFTYDIGCNEKSSDYAKCVGWLYHNSGTTASPVYPTIKTRENGIEKSQNIKCVTTTPTGALSPVTTCTLILPTGGLPVTVFSGDANSFQTTLYSLTRDTIPPTASIAYFTQNNAQLDPSQYALWQRQPVNAVITCTDKPGKSDGSNCACASTLLETGGQQFWSSGIPSSNPKEGADVMSYSRLFINNSTGPASVTVRDTAGNVTPISVTNIGVDSVAPKITVTTPSANRVTISVTDPTDGGSGLWKPASLRPLPGLTPAIQKNPAAPGILYRTFSKSAYSANPSLYEFNDTCLLTGDNADYYAYGQPGASMTQSLTNLLVNGVTGSFSTTTNMIAYCVQDNAGNVTRGVYPSDPVGCFSASNLPTVPTLSTARNLLLTKLSSSLPETQKYGYGLSEDRENTSCFENILTSNINSLVKSQYAPDITAFSWNNPAYILNLSPTQRNTQGYYYYLDNATLPAPAIATTLGSLLVIPSSPSGTGQKVIVTEGKNIQINADIKYNGGNKQLVIIARKNAKGGGGNILIDPSVTRIDAILIADGALINASNGVLKNTVSHASLLTSRLTLNGRLYSFNHRGGSLLSSDLSQLPATTTFGRYFNGSALVTNGTLTPSVQSDLERFRMILNDGSPLCTFHINYQLFNNAALPPILERPTNFSGGTCSF